MSGPNFNVTTRKAAAQGEAANLKRQTSDEVDGVSAVGFELSTDVVLSTDGSKVFSLKNDTAEYFNIRKGTDLFDETNQVLFEFKDAGGVRRGQLAAYDVTDNEGLYLYTDYGFWIESNNDWTDTNPDRASISYGGGAWPGDYGYFTLTASHFHGDPAGNDMAYLQMTGGDSSEAGLKISNSITNSGALIITDWRLSGVDQSVQGSTTDLRMYCAARNTSGFLGWFGLNNEGKFVGKTDVTWGFESRVATGASAIAFDLDTETSLTSVGAKLLSVKNSSVEKASIDKDGNTDIVGEISIKVYSQTSEPTLTADNRMAMWIDTDDSNKVYFIFRRGSGDQVKVQLT